MPRRKRNSSQTARPVERPARRRLGGKSENPRAAAPARKKALPPTGGDSSSDDEEDNRAAAVDAPANEAPVHAPFKAPDPTRTVLFDDDDDDAAPPPPGSPRCVVCSTTRDVFIVERAPVWKSTSVGLPDGVEVDARRRREVLISLHRRAQDLLRAEFYAWCCSSCARKYVKPRPDPKELCFATDDDEPLSPMKRTRLSF